MAVKAAKGPPRRISQETFDEAVQENIDDFDLEPDEAVADAVKEFELQNVDLSEIDKSYAGPEGRGEHPVVVPTEMFVKAVEDVAKDPGSVEKRGKVEACTMGLRVSISGWNIPGWGAAATGAGAVQAAHLNVMNAATISDEVESQIRATRAELLTSALDLLAVVLGADEAKQTFAALKFPMEMARAAWPSCAAAGTANDRLRCMAAFAKAVAAAADKCEANKGAFVKAEAETCLVAILREAEAASPADAAAPVPAADATLGPSATLLSGAAYVVREGPGHDAYGEEDGGAEKEALAASARTATREACSAIRALTTGDDPREPASGAFAHARALAKAGAATALCAALAREAAAENVDLRLAQQLAAATRHVAVNDDICRETADRGGLITALRLLRGPATGSARCTKACAQLVRQLAGSDAAKRLILRFDGIAALAHCARVFAERAATAKAPDLGARAQPERALRMGGGDLAVVPASIASMAKEAQERLDREDFNTPSACLAATEQCVGALAAACLKRPEAATACASANAFEIVAEAMAGAVGVSHAGLQRQACMFFRNAVVRNPELRAAALATTAEASLRSAKKNHPAACADVATAALRDLGCDNYNEGYNPTTAVMGADGVVRTPEELGDEPDVGAVRAIAGYGSAMPSLAE